MSTSAQVINDARRFAWWTRRQLKNRAPGKAKDRPFGWSLLGVGHFSRVYEHPDYPGIVLKLSCRGGALEEEFDPDSKYSAHDAWQPFAKMCMLNPAPHLPAIYHYEQLTQSYAFAIMKRYSPVSGSGKDYYTLRDQWEVWLRRGAKAPAWLWPAMQMQEMMGLQVDLHSANIMWDGDTLILTDPFSIAGISPPSGSCEDTD